MSIKPARVPYVEGEPPPIGYALCESLETGERYWANPGSVAMGASGTSKLTPEQVLRVKNFAFVFREHHKDEVRSIAKVIGEFERDENPAREIRLWEIAAKTYLQELKRRPGAAPGQRKLLYTAILSCMTASTDPGEMVSQFPQLKGLSKLARVAETYEVIHKATPTVES